LLSKIPPPLQQFTHTLWRLCAEFQHFSCGWVLKTKHLSMQTLPGDALKAVLNKALITATVFSAQHRIASIKGVIKKGMPQVFHVHSNLMCAARFQPAMHQGNKTQ
jgi:hypothetical protein